MRAGRGERGLGKPHLNWGSSHVTQFGPALPNTFRGSQMKKLVIALLATVVAFSVAGCAGVGKGKARPAVVTKG